MTWSFRKAPFSLSAKDGESRSRAPLPARSSASPAQMGPGPGPEPLVSGKAGSARGAGLGETARGRRASGSGRRQRLARRGARDEAVGFRRSVAPAPAAQRGDWRHRQAGPAAGRRPIGRAGILAGKAGAGGHQLGPPSIRDGAGSGTVDSVQRQAPNFGPPFRGLWRAGRRGCARPGLGEAGSGLGLGASASFWAPLSPKRGGSKEDGGGEPHCFARPGKERCDAVAACPRRKISFSAFAREADGAANTRF